MEYMIDTELLKKLRNEKNWSQEELAIASDLSLRTVQRVERSGNCSLESKRALSAALDTDVDKLDFKKPNRLSKLQLLKITNYSKTMAALLFFPMVLAILILFIRNYQSTAEFNIVIEDQNGIYSDTITIELQQSWTKVIKLHNDYSLEVDYIYGLTPRLKSQLYFIGDDEKILLHSSNRKGTEFQPVKYEVSSLGNVRFVSPFTDLDNG